MLIKTIFLILVFFPCYSFAAAPVVYYSDMTDGPVSGWDGSATKGAAVSIYANNIGASRGTSYVTVGGVNLTAASDYVEWGATTNPHVARGMKRITFWLNSNMATGGTYPNTTISVTTPEGTSTTIPFHTRLLGSNHIYFLNQQSSPAWARENLVAGDVAYMRAGTYNTEDDDTATHSWAKEGIMDFCYGSPKNFHDGSEGNSITITAYPGELVKMEAIQLGLHPRSIVRIISTHIAYWTFAKFECNALQPFEISDDVDNPDGKLDNIRISSMDITTPWFDNSDPNNSDWGDGIDILNGDNSTDLKILGNYIHDLAVDYWGQPQTDPVDGYRSYGIYVKGYGQITDLAVAYNEVYHDASRGMQFYGHKAHDKITNLYLHDNWVHECDRQCIVLNGGDGWSDYTYIDNSIVYNNILDHCGETDFTIQLGNTTSHGGHGGSYKVWNNIFHQEHAAAPMAVNYDAMAMEFKNNIIITLPNGHNYWEYFSYQENELTFTPVADHNIYHGAGANTTPGWENSTLTNNDPLFVQSAPVDFEDFKLQITSPGVNAGVTIALVTTDIIKVTRPQGSAYDIGAYEFIDSTGPARSEGSPTGEQAAGTTQVTMSLTTDVNATCRYNADGVSGVAYASMADTMSGGGTTSHTATITGLSDGNSYSRAVRCSKTSDGEANTDDYLISFSVASSGVQHKSVQLGSGTKSIQFGSGTKTITFYPN